MKLFRSIICLALVALVAAGLVPASPALAQDGDCSKSPAPQFEFDERVEVTTELGAIAVPIYQGATQSSALVGELRPGEGGVIQHVDAQCDRGYRYWFMLTDDGQVGWVPSALDLDDNLLNDYDVVLVVPSVAAPPSDTLPDAGVSPVIFADDFSDVESGWAPGEGENYRVGYENGQWHMELLQTWTSMWSRPVTGATPLDDLADFTAQIDITPVDDVGAAGIAFRLDTNGDNYYQFLYRPASGEYRLRVRRNGSWSTLIDWTVSPALNVYPATNRLAVTAQGGTLMLYANGQLLDTFEDASVASGRLGFALWRTDEETDAGLVADYTFDNLLVTGPIVPGDQPQPQAEEQFLTLSDAPVIFADDFSNPDSGWAPGLGDNYNVGYLDGQWNMQLLQTWTSMWSRPITGATPLDDLADFTAQIDITPVDDVGAAGIAFRLDTNGDNYYQFLYRPASGEYRLRVRRAASWSTLIDWTASPALALFPSTNRLAITAQGSTLMLYANGQLLDVIEDTSVAGGRLGFAIWRTDEETDAGLVADYTFDNLLVTGPVALGAPALADDAGGAPVIFADDFSSTESGWDPSSGTDYMVDYRFGSWHMEIFNTWTSLWTRPRTGETPIEFLTDFTAQVDVTAASEVGAAGFAFRLDSGGSGYYQYLIRPATGEYRLRMRANDTWTTLVDWTQSPAIAPYPSTNRLGVTANGSTFALYVNGLLLDVVADPSLSQAGFLGFALWRSDDETDANLTGVFKFDNLLVTEPVAVAAAPADAAPAGAQPAAEGALIFSDDFSNTASGWESWSEDNYTVSYRGAKWHMELFNDWVDVWTHPMAGFTPLENLADFTAEVDIDPVTAAGGAGLVFRMNPAGNAYYQFVIRPGTGEYALRSRENGSWRMLAGWTQSDAIAGFPATNRIRVTAAGNTFTLYANDQLLETVTDSAHTSGWLGLTVTRTQEDMQSNREAIADFDNLEVYDR